MHGEFTTIEDVDWTPCRYYSTRAPLPFGVAMVTVELEPADGGTTGHSRSQPDPAFLQTFEGRQMVEMIEGVMVKSFEQLAEVLRERTLAQGYVARPPRSRERFDAEVRVPRDDIEICVSVQKGRSRTDGDCRNQAIDQSTNRFAACAACSVDGRRQLVIVEAGDGQHVEGEHRSPQMRQLSDSAGPGKELHHDRFRGRQSSPAFQQAGHPLVDRTAGLAQELDPCRGIDQRHHSSTGSL